MILDKINEDETLVSGTLQDLKKLLSNRNKFSREQVNELNALMQIMLDFPSDAKIEYYKKNGYNDIRGIDASIQFKSSPEDESLKIQIINAYKDKTHGAKDNLQQKLLAKSVREQEKVEDLVSKIASYCKERYNAQRLEGSNHSNKIPKIQQAILKVFQALGIKEDFLGECYGGFLERFVLPFMQLKFIFDEAKIQNYIREKLQLVLDVTVFHGSAASRYLIWVKNALEHKMDDCSKNLIDILLIVIPDDTLLITTSLEDEALSLINNFPSLCEDLCRNNYPKTVYCVFPRTALPFLKWSSNL